MRIQQKPHRIGQLRHIPDALCHPRQPGGIEHQPVQHHRRDGTGSRFQIGGVRRENLRLMIQQRIGHGLQRVVFLPGGQNGYFGLCCLCLFQHFSHGAASFETSCRRIFRPECHTALPAACHS